VQGVIFDRPRENITCSRIRSPAETGPLQSLATRNPMDRDPKRQAAPGAPTEPWPGQCSKRQGLTGRIAPIADRAYPDPSKRERDRWGLIPRAL